MYDQRHNDSNTYQLQKKRMEMLRRLEQEEEDNNYYEEQKKKKEAPEESGAEKKAGVDTLPAKNGNSLPTNPANDKTRHGFGSNAEKIKEEENASAGQLNINGAVTKGEGNTNKTNAFLQQKPLEPSHVKDGTLQQKDGGTINTPSLILGQGNTFNQNIAQQETPQPETLNQKQETPQQETKNQKQETTQPETLNQKQETTQPETLNQKQETPKPETLNQKQETPQQETLNQKQETPQPETLNQKPETPQPETLNLKQETPQPETPEEPAPADIVANYENPPQVKTPKTEAAKDAKSEEVEPDEDANINITGLATVAQQFRDQGKETLDDATNYSTLRKGLEQDKNSISKKITKSDKDLGTAQTNIKTREDKLPELAKAAETSKQRQQKVETETIQHKAEADKNSSTANQLKGESASLLGGSKKNADPKEADSGTLTNQLGELSGGADTMAGGVSGAGSKALQLAAEAKQAKEKNLKAEKDQKELKAGIDTSKTKIETEKKHNTTAKSEIKQLDPKLADIKKKETQLTTDGKSLMDVSFDVENDVHKTQHHYYQDMSKVESRENLMIQEAANFQNTQSAEGDDAIMFAYAKLETEAEQIAYIESLPEAEQLRLGNNLETFTLNFDKWSETKQNELAEKAEAQRSQQVGQVNTKRNTNLSKPLGTVNKNFDKISKIGLLGSSIGQSLSGIWKSITSVTWADVSKLGLAMIDPRETWKTLSGAVKGIWTDLSNWGGFSKDPVGMILQKGVSVSGKLLTIAGVITGILAILTIAAAVASVFTLGAAGAAAVWLGSATVTMGTITFWIGAVSLGLNILSGIKNTYEVHSAKSADVLFKNTAELKKDAAGATTSILAMAGAKGTAAGGNAIKQAATKAPKTFGKTMLTEIKNNLVSFPGKVARGVAKLFKKETWTNLYASFKKAFKGKKDEVGDLSKHDLPETPKKHSSDFDNTNKQTKTETEAPKKQSVKEKTPDKEPTKKAADEPELKNKRDKNADKEPDENYKKREKDVEDGEKEKMKKKADEDIPDGPDADNKRRALFMAKVIITANDKIDTPIPALLTELNAMGKTMKGVPPFKAISKGEGKYEIWMNPKASNYDIAKEGEEKDKEGTENNNDGDEKESTKDNSQEKEKDVNLDNTLSSPKTNENKIEKINGQTPINAKDAGKTIKTKSGYEVKIKENGFPEFTPHSKKNVEIRGLKGNHDSDFRASNKAAGFGDSPDAHLTFENGKYKDYTWHHHEDGKTMQLVPKKLNNPSAGGLSHTGGAAVIKHNTTKGNTKFDFPSPEY